MAIERIEDFPFRLEIEMTGINGAERSFTGLSKDEGLMLAEWRRWKDSLSNPHVKAYRIRYYRKGKLINEETKP